MKIAIIGASGNVGKKLVPEALSRGHQVTAIARKTEGLKASQDLRWAKGDVHQPEELAKILVGHDVAICSVPFAGLDYDKLIHGIKLANTKRLLVVGGAGSLEIAPGKVLVDSPEFPAEYKPEATAALKFLNKLRLEKDLDWTFLSPSAMFLPEGRTGNFRLGKDQLLANSKGQSQVTMADFSIAMLDEIERPQHRRQRFTVVDAS